MNLEIKDGMWIEKYRPTDLDNIILNNETRKIIEKWMVDGIFPNLFLCSGPGQGKTSLAVLLCKMFDSEYLIINCSDENDVNTVRENVKNFAETLSFNGRFKTVILDEADGFASVRAQEILRRLMEETSDNARFIITANYKKKIIEPIRSRCIELNMLPSKEDAVKHFINIIKNEKVYAEDFSLQKRLLKELVYRFFPDFRSILKLLQLSVDSNNVIDIVDYKPNDEFLLKIYNYVIGGADNAIELRKYVIENENLFRNDYQMLIDDFYHYIIDKEDVPQNKKMKWVVILADHLFKAQNCIDQELNFSACMFKIME